MADTDDSQIDEESVDDGRGDSPTGSVPGLEAFGGDPRGTEHAYLLDEAFAKEVLALVPAWQPMASSMLDVLRAFDECGLLRPRLRLRLPEAYAWWSWHGDPNPVRDALTPDEWDRFDYVKYGALGGRRAYSDPASVHPIGADAVLAPYLEPGEHEPAVDWTRWRVRVDDIQYPSGHVQAVTRDFVHSLYAPWQRYRAWALLEQFTVRALLDPRRGEPDALFGGASFDLTGKHLMRQVGQGRPGYLLDRIEAAGWMTALYRARAIMDWAEARVARPDLVRWPEGESLAPDERWAAERTRLEARCRALADPWAPSSVRAADDAADTGIPAPFLAQLRHLLELWRWATKQDATAFTTAVHADLFTAAEWAIFAFGTTFDAVNDGVGTLSDHDNTTLALAVQPARVAARRIVEQALNVYLPQYNGHTPYPVLEAADSRKFLDYLDAHELWAWTLELAGWLEADNISGDVNRDRRFLHIRSLALLNEQLIATLAEEYGTEQDRINVGRGGVQDPLKAFLTERCDWRAEVWHAVSTNWRLTGTSARVGSDDLTAWASMTPTARVCARLDAIAALALPPRATAARQILLFATARNFGAHRFSRDAKLVHHYGGSMVGGVLFSALLYWKVATTLK